MKILAFYLGRHDSNLCLYDYDTRSLVYAKSERLLNIKRHAADLEFVSNFCRERGFSPDVVVYSDGNRNGLGSCPEDENIVAVDAPSVFKQAAWYNVDHHFAHVFSAWPIQDLDSVTTAIVVDGQGDHLRRVSVFRNPKEFGPPIYTSTEHQIGHFFVQVGITLKLTGQLDDYAGKVMGAQSYGVSDEDVANRLVNSGIERDLFRMFRTTHWKGNQLNSSFYNFENQEFRDWLATAHSVCGKVVLSLFRRFCEAKETILYSGGVALNTVINSCLKKEFPQLVIPPNCYDGGLSLGCLEIVRRHLGLEALRAKHFPFIQEDQDFGEADASTIKRAAELLSAGKIVGWIQGHGEIGPRALGHRSILVQPMSAETKEHLNTKVKKREYWRPYAPAVLAGSQESYFFADFLSPHMLYTAPVVEQKRESIPAVVHVDGTARFQSVDAVQCEGMATFELLLKEFEKITGIPVLLNTSFNAGGKPIVARDQDAIDFFNNSGLDALVLGNQFLVK